ncbi:hypothetical protein [Fimbriiglobus ruber]|uniref:HTH cro/C1-type domain-containing protein n=1 Tax=Fimbriiglobus ruber TaxID=1908690 RepID=A0A225DXQ5_9BACT|nr:hypothetical protein [Fimbriiglobus ruber]OWK42019.1 hypothetical protein FRUB_04097 [Fimbriiglobus ruber]
MTPAVFRSLAAQLAGPRWKTKLGPMIGKCRTQVWEYASGERKVPETVEKLMKLLSQSPDSTHQQRKEEP